jgi:hypothetical protein
MLKAVNNLFSGVPKKVLLSIDTSGMTQLFWPSKPSAAQAAHWV